jgi:Cu2+-exporting ATPase
VSAISASPGPASVTAERLSCTHCTLPCPPSETPDEKGHAFCCEGCRAVHAILAGHGLEGYYRVRDAADPAPERAKTTGRHYTEFDDTGFRAVHCRPAQGGESIDLLLEGVHCAACVWLVERLPRVCPGVVESRLNMRRAVVSVRFDPRETSPARVATALDKLGYRPHPARSAERAAARIAANRAFLVRVGVAGACAGNVMLLAIALYGGAFAGIEPFWETVFRWYSLVIGAVCLAWPGAVFFRGAWAAIRTRSPHLDLPIAIALAAGGLWGASNVIRGTGEIYFDSLCALVFLLLVGRWVQSGQQRRAADAVELLFTMTPTSARVVTDDGELRDTPIDAVQPGQLVEVRAGDVVPVDGQVERGESEADISLLTGESRPKPLVPGDEVAAGSVNLLAALRIRVSASGGETRVGRLMRMVAESAEAKSPIVRFADRASGVFVVVVVSLAVLTVALWAHISLDLAIEHATALLIVMCPCAFGLATPMAMTVATARAARDGVLIKGADTLERLAERGTLLLDKTGTLTEGNFRVAATTGDDTVWREASALERGIEHPIAIAIAEIDTTVPAPDESRYHAGGGVTGRVGGSRVVAGSLKFVREHAADLPPELAAWCAEQAERGRTNVVVWREGAFGAAALEDTPRAEARELLDRVRARGWRVGIVSGDDPRAVASAAEQVGIPVEDARGGVTPEGKLDVVREVEATGQRVVMVGDGINDAAALAAAGVGISVAGGAEASLEAADVYLAKPGLGGIERVLDTSRHAMRTIYLCLGVSASYNVALGSLAIAGLIHPVIAAILMPLSSLTVVSICVRPARARKAAAT